MARGRVTADVTVLKGWGGGRARNAVGFLDSCDIELPFHPSSGPNAPPGCGQLGGAAAPARVGELGGAAAAAAEAAAA